jgi:hypothetical protein
MRIRTKKRYDFDYERQNEYNLNIQVPEREKELNVLYKKKKKMRISRNFMKERSVFRKWKEDTEEVLEEVYQYDMTFSKIHRMVRDPTDVRLILTLKSMNSLLKFAKF